MSKIYTTTGDDGSTALIGGKRVSKDDPRIEAYGTVDELNAVLGAVRSFSLPEPVEKTLGRIQDELFRIGANLALTTEKHREKWRILPITQDDIKALESDIDDCQSVLTPLRRFVIPGGTTAGAMMHLARTVARRAERRCVTLAGLQQCDPRIVRYLNRLSDLCFVLARLINRENSLPETHPSSGRSRSAQSDPPDSE
jgi:cob(I)alamin adenosyltransferase